jgi:hypothetical protein
MPDKLYKYPRTHHLQGSRFQPGDEELDDVPLSMLAGRYLIIEEKLDGANAGISFSGDGRLQLQSRGHFLRGGGREAQFALFKQWAHSIAGPLWEVPGTRYVLYGDWLYAKHTLFYDALPHYFLEFDVRDTETDDTFLGSRRRRELLAGLPVIPVPVVFEGRVAPAPDLARLITGSRYIRPGHLDHLRSYCEQHGLDVERALAETDLGTLMEGLYFKVEDENGVLERYKFVRASFLTGVVEPDTHWLNRPTIPNRLLAGVDLFRYPG